MGLFPAYRVVFMKNTKNGAVEVGRRKWNPKKTTIDYKGGTYLTLIEEVSHHKGNNHFLYKDFDTGQSMAWNAGFLLADPKSLTTLIADKLAKAAVNAGSSDYGLLAVLACAMVGLFAGLFLMTILYPMLFPNMMKPAEKAAMAVTLLCR